jgi:hypothetical protein
MGGFPPRAGATRISLRDVSTSTTFQRRPARTINWPRKTGLSIGTSPIARPSRVSILADTLTACLSPNVTTLSPKFC